MWKITGTGISAVKGKFEDFIPGNPVDAKSCFTESVKNPRSSAIIGSLPSLFSIVVNKSMPGLVSNAHFGGGITVWNGIVFIKSAEVVDADYIVDF